jgi:hypothetical protein
MKNWKWLLLSGLGACLVLSLAVPAHAEGHKYIGAEKCKMCHNSPAKGAQFTKWSESKHAKAFAALATDQAKKVAQSKGIADPQKAADCLKCHVTGHGAPADQLGEKYKADEGVSCESCHGPGGDYMAMAVMKDHAKAVAAGMTDPTEETCKKCHNAESPTFKEFNFATASAAIAHPNPQKGGGK